jgi:hypothetical protein
MEIKNLLPAIVALLIVASLVSLSTTSVSATTSSTIDKTLVKANTPMVLTVTVTNSGASLIDNVRIIVENGSGFVPLSTVPKDNVVNCAVDNVVVLPAGTIVELLENANIVLSEGTEVILLENKQVWVPRLLHNTQMNENILVAPRQDTNAVNIPLGDNIMVTQGVSVNLNNDNRLRLLENTSVTVVSGNIVKLPENTLFGLVAQNDNGIAAGENVDVTKDVTVTLADNRVKLVTPNPGSSPSDNLPAGENLQLIDNQVVVTAGTTVQLGSTVAVRIAENENVLRVKDSQLDATGATVLTQPENWTQTTGITEGLSTVPAVEWKGSGDNIPVGGSRSFPFAWTSPNTTQDRAPVRIWVKTPGSIENPLTVMVDGKSPTVSVTASPSYVGGNAVVTITVVASEELAMLDNVMVAENNATENTQVTMTSSDNITWTGTYTTENDWTQDGDASVYVIGSGYQDEVGNIGTDNMTTFTIDREAPPEPDISALMGWPSTPTNVDTWLIEGTAWDNFLNTISPLANGTVKVRVGTTTTDVTTNATGYFYQSVTLAQGTQELGISYMDTAGNVGPENAENITLDSIPPVITPNTISGKTFDNGVLINDNTPTVNITITDATLGIENVEFGSTGDNHGYEVELWDENGVEITDLTNATPPAEEMPNTISFENTYPTPLVDGTYQIYVVAGDNLQMDNLVITFVIDTTPPAAPGLTATASQNPLAPDIRTNTTVSLGGTAEPGATVNIWTSPDPFTTETNVASVVAGTDGTWIATITIDQGVTVRIRVSQVDTAGNASTTKATYGYLKVDASAPVVTISSPTTGTKTDKSTITVSGSVTKDAWESYSLDITLRVQNGITSTSIVIPIANDGTFSVNVPLAEGKNSIIATATDSVGNYTSFSVTVERTVTSWAIYAIILVIIALILAAIAIFRMR